MGCGQSNTRVIKASNQREQYNKAIEGKMQLFGEKSTTNPHILLVGSKRIAEITADGMDEEFAEEFGTKRFNKAGFEIGLYDRTVKLLGTVNIGANFQFEHVGTGDQALACKPWKGAIKPPTYPPEIMSGPPSVDLLIEYVYGYRCHDTRQNVYYTAQNNEIVYMAAALGIVLNTAGNTQKIYGGGQKAEGSVDALTGHIDDIISIAIHPNKNIIATGEKGKNPKICIWNADQALGINEMRQGRGSRAVISLAFSNNGQHLVSVAQDDQHMVRVWDWRSGQPPLYQDKGGVDKIMDSAWSLSDDAFCTVGIKHIFFWNRSQGPGEVSYTKKRGISKNHEVINMSCVQSLAQGSFVTGGMNGALYIWTGNQCLKNVQLHSGSIHTLRISGSTVLCGGSDKALHVLDSSLAVKKTFQLHATPRACDISEDKIVVGCRDGSILEIIGDVVPQNESQYLIESHSDGEVWGLEVAPGNQNFVVTTGDDNKIKVWDPNTRKCVARDTLEIKEGPKRKVGAGASTMTTHTSPNQQSRCVAIHPTNGHIAIAHNDGHLTIRESVQNLAHWNKRIEETTKGRNVRCPKEWTETMKYSPNGKWLAVGNHDDHIYIYDVNNNYKFKDKIHKHSSFLTALDWSCDSTALKTCSGDYELLYWSMGVDRIMQNTAGASGLKDEKWNTYSTHFGWHVKGIFGKVIDYTHVNRVDRSHNSRFFAIGNDFGDVELFNSPNNKRSESKSFAGHSEHVTNVKWSADDKRVFSTGGYDQCLIQWKVIN